jgi:mannose-6-phosphate isomerase-like protein (cupin superfamily)
MLKTVDIAVELEKLTFLDGRTKDTSSDEEEGSFADLSRYRDGGVFVGGFSGESPWERHVNGDELVQVLEGKTTLTILAPDGPESFEMGKGMLIVVPQGHWHRFKSKGGVTVLTVTPQPTQHSTAEDPRTAG